MTQHNKDLPSRSTTVFLHIPKTAGTTLYTIMDRQFELRQTVTINGERDHLNKLKEIKDSPAKARKKIELIKGHTYIGWHEILPQKVTYFTLLRNPIDRFISHYYYIKNLPTHPLYTLINEKNISLTDYAFMQGEDNGQTRFLATAIDNGEIEYRSEECSTEILDKAKENLQKYCAVVGIVEDFDKTLLLLKKKFGWSNIFYVVKNKNKSRRSKREISKETLKIIEKQHEYDLELYDYSKDLFARLIAEQDEDFAKDLHNFQNLNSSMYGKFSTFTATSAVKFQKLLFPKHK